MKKKFLVAIAVLLSLAACGSDKRNLDYQDNNPNLESTSKEDWYTVNDEFTGAKMRCFFTHDANGVACYLWQQPTQG